MRTAEFDDIEFLHSGKLVILYIAIWFLIIRRRILTLAFKSYWMPFATVYMYGFSVLLVAECSCRLIFSAFPELVAAFLAFFMLGSASQVYTPPRLWLKKPNGTRIYIL